MSSAVPFRSLWVVLAVALPAWAQVPSVRAALEDPLSAAVLDRGAVIREALARNPSVGAARAAVREAQGRVSQATALDDPQLSYGVAPASLFDSAVNDGHVVRIEQRLPFPGKRGLAGEEATADVKAGGAELEQTRLDLALEANRLYDAWFAVHRAIEINAQHLDLLRAFKQSAEAEYTTGRASQQDPLQAEVELTHVEHLDVTLGADRDVLRAQLNALLHRPPGAPLPPPPSELALPEETATDATPLFDAAVRQRPELAAVRARVGGAQAALALAHRQALPDFTVMGEYNSMWMDPAHRWMVGVGINVPLPWDRRAGQAEEASARGERLQFEEQRMLDQVRTEVETARLRLDEAVHVVRLYRTRLVPAAEDEVTAARAGFVVGRNPFNTLIDAERNLRSVQLAYAQSLADADVRRAELDRALGQSPDAASGAQP